MSAFLSLLSAPPHQTLRILQTTQSTVSYTVTTRPTPRTLAATIAYYIAVQFRLVVGLCMSVLVWIKWRVTFEQSTPFLAAVMGMEVAEGLVNFANMCDWMYLAPGTLVVLFLVCKRGYTEESLTVLRGLGVQTSTTSSTYLQTPTTRFIPTTSIQDIVIHEAFKGFEIRLYLAIVVDGEEDVVVVFPRLLPRRAILEQVWRGTRRCLWEGNSYRK